MKELDAQQIWNPSGADRWEACLSQGLRGKGSKTLDERSMRDIVHSLQYLEYMTGLLAPKNLHPVLEEQLIKTYLVITISVSEALLFYGLEANSALSEDVWQDIENSRHHHPFFIGDEELRIRVALQEKLTRSESKTLSFNIRVRRAEEKKLLGIDHEIYALLHYLRILRNRIHIYQTESESGENQEPLDRKHFKKAKEVLHAILSSPQFSESGTGKENAKLLGFLEQTDSVAKR